MYKANKRTNDDHCGDIGELSAASSQNNMAPSVVAGSDLSERNEFATASKFDEGERFLFGIAYSMVLIPTTFFYVA